MSVSVTVQVVVPAGSPASVTVGRRDTELSCVWSSVVCSFDLFLFQVADPLVAPLQLKTTFVTLLKLLPDAVVTAWKPAVLVVNEFGLRPVKDRKSVV